MKMLIVTWLPLICNGLRPLPGSFFFVLFFIRSGVAYPRTASAELLISFVHFNEEIRCLKPAACVVLSTLT